MTVSLPLQIGELYVSLRGLACYRTGNIRKFQAIPVGEMLIVLQFEEYESFVEEFRAIPMFQIRLLSRFGDISLMCRQSTKIENCFHCAK